ncbi:hypothetical protein GGS20DRAFT_535950 [Poronia punctata]|nr:hypothetical protein GGS20DRAFT_535950 [Poronia punctata]
MKLNSFLLPALAGIATADSTPSHAEAYMLRHAKQSTTSEPPSIPDSLAEAILLQRLSSPSHPAALGKLPSSLDEDEAISYVNEFGTPARPLFASTAADEPKQLLIAFSASTADDYKSVKAAIPRVPLAFTAPGLRQVPAKVTSDCAFQQAVDPESKGASKCWRGKTQYLQYDITSNTDIVKQLSASLATLKSYANKGLMETVIVFLDPSAPEADDLQKRQELLNEKVMTDAPAQESDSDFTFVTSTHASDDLPDRHAPIPACFTSQNACETATNSCSGHGLCVDRWAQDATEKSCFSCRCKKTLGGPDNKKVYNWGGAMCQKRDISTPFWLFVGVSITLMAAIAFSISLLFNVGEQQLPGVIGAGVSRSK